MGQFNFISQSFSFSFTFVHSFPLSFSFLLELSLQLSFVPPVTTIISTSFCFSFTSFPFSFSLPFSPLLANISALIPRVTNWICFNVSSSLSFSAFIISPSSFSPVSSLLFALLLLLSLPPLVFLSSFLYF